MYVLDEKKVSHTIKQRKPMFFCATECGEVMVMNDQIEEQGPPTCPHCEKAYKASHK